MLETQRPELQSAVERAEQLARDVLAPNAERYDRSGEFPQESIQALRSSGLVGLLIPREYGGLDGGPRTFAGVLMALGRVCPSTAMIFSMHSGVARNIARHALEATKQRFLPKMANGELLACSARNEPNASVTRGYVGSLRESLVPTPDGGYRYTTTKFFATGSSGADYISSLGRVVDAPPERSELWVLTPRDAPGVEVEETWDTLGMRATRSNYVHFRDCVVEPDAMIGRPGKGLLGDYSLFGQAVVSLAIGEATFDFARRFVRGEAGETTGVDLAKDPNVQREIGEIELQLEAVRMIFHEVCLAFDTDDDRIIGPALQRAWYYSKVAGADVPYRVLQLVGGRGIYRYLPLERHVRDGLSISLMGPHRDALASGIGSARLGDGPQFRSFWLD